MADQIPQIPPHDQRAEEAVLSACMLDPDAPVACSAVLRPESFYSEAHRRIFEAVVDLAAEHRAVDVVSIATWLKDRGRIQQIGGSPALTELLNRAPAVANVVTHAEAVARKHRMRKLVLAAQRIVAEGYLPVGDEDDFIARAEQTIHEVGAARAAGMRARSMRDVLRDVFTKLQEASSRSDAGYTGTPTGFEVLDEATGGLHDGESTILAARPGMGKTSLAMNIAAKVAKRGLGVLVFSLEMPNEQIATRALCSEARVDGRKARTNRFDKNDWRSLTAAVQRAIEPEHFYLVDQPSGLLEMRSMCRSKASELARVDAKLGLVVVDYVQLMTTREGIRSREEAVSENARGLKMLAKELACPVLVLSQLNRGVESRNDKRPMLSDLRESGALEEAADCVIGMYRDDYYDQGSKAQGIVELSLLKHRHGPTGTVEVGFEARSTTFFNLRHERDDSHAEACRCSDCMAEGRTAD